MVRTRTEEIETWAAHQAALDALRTALSVLDSIGVRALVVKGMVLAYELHDDVAERPMADVDLRVRPRDVVRAFRALRAHGFACDWTTQLGAMSFYVGHMLVEIEATIGPPGLCAISVSRMLDRSRERLMPNGVRVNEPELHDHAVLLVVNAFKDKMVACPTWSLDDLATMAGRMDADTFLARVEEARLQTVTWIAADWMARERGSAAWRLLRDRLGGHPQRSAYARAMLRLIDRAPRSMSARVLARIGSDSLRRRVWALAGTCAGGAIPYAGALRRDATAVDS